MYIPHPLERGARIARVLSGSWRADLPVGDVSDCADLVEALRRSGEAALVWRRLRGTRAAGAKGLRGLRDEYRTNVVVGHNSPEQLGQLFPALQSAGVDAILIKGWGVARLFPEPGLRPITDHDICVCPSQFEAASAVVAGRTREFGLIDLHEGVTDLPDRSFAAIVRRAQTANVGDAAIRLPGPEDQLRLVALHAWRHNFNRPLNLCDLGLLLESLPSEFDWDYFRSGDRVLTAWALSALELTRRLLGARFHWPADLASGVRVPGWLIPAVLWRWGAWPSKPSVRHFVRRPVELVRALRHHWLNPVKVCYRLRVPPRWPYAWVQLLGLAARPEEMLARARRWRRGGTPGFQDGYAVHPADASRFC